MFTLRCTRALLKRLGQPTAEVLPPTTILGDWYANLLTIGRLRLVLCTSERTLLTVVVPSKELPRLPDRLRGAVARMLTRLDVSAAAIAKEDREMQQYHVGETASRQVLGSMVDFSYLAEAPIRDDGEPDLDEVAAFINRAPCRPIKYASPARATQAAFTAANASDAL